MPVHKSRRRGTQLLIKKRPVSFSYWPTYQGTTRWGLQSTLFAFDPWTVISSKVKSDCPQTARVEALAYIDQARDYFISSSSAKIAAARPVLLYYCFLNLAKAFVLHSKRKATLVNAQHGIAERVKPNGSELIDAYMEAYPSPGPKTKKLQVFDEFLRAVKWPGVTSGKQYQLPNLLPQIVPGHRLWAEAANKEERFIALHEIRFFHNRKSKLVWLRLYLFNDDLTRLGVTHGRLLQEADLSPHFTLVYCTKQIDKRRLVCLESNMPVQYSHSPADKLQDVIGIVKDRLWVTVASAPPYRRYYLYLCPPSERAEVLPQLLSIYATTYYLSSLTRYRPHIFDRILQGEYGPRIEEFIAGQTFQFVYLMASEFAKQEVTRPSIV